MNRIIMITGATAGFGRATSLKFAQNGFNIIISGRRKERLDILEKEISAFNTGVLSLNFDVRNNHEVTESVSNLPSEWKNIDILVNNAGLAAGLSHIENGDTDDWDTMIDTNVRGLLYVTRAVSPLMVARKSGHIINVSSIAGDDIYENGNVYCATKSAVNSLSKAMRIDLLKHNIKVTNIEPGMAETEFSMVRFKGDREKSEAVYRGVKSLTAGDIAGIIYFCATLPSHVCINNLAVTPTQQAAVGILNRLTK
jgi:3-hydroxy acid dehydrogenase/malonic semialdehyde reductase